MKQTEKKKQKLTLSVDPDVVKKARDIGINISEITEGILRGFSFTPSGTETDSLYEKYDQLFETMLPLLKKYGTSVKVGSFEMVSDRNEHFDDCDILLTNSRNFWFTEIEYEVKEIKQIDINSFFQPKKILTNFIESLSKSAENRKQQLTELEMARRIIEAISNAPPKKILSKSKTIKFDTKKGKKRK